MRCVILCGGKGMRLNGGTDPKALAVVKGHAMVEHVMATYAPLSPEFFLLVGHKGEAIEKHFAKHERTTCMNTGEATGTGGRLKRWVEKYKLDATFATTYADGLCNLDVQALLAFHKSHGKLATVTAVPAVSKFGVLKLDCLTDDAGEPLYELARVASFREKPRTNDWISAGFFCFEPGVFDYLDDGLLEEGPMRRLVEAGELMAYKHNSFFMAVDSPKDLEQANAYSEPLPWVRK